LSFISCEAFANSANHAKNFEGVAASVDLGFTSSKSQISYHGTDRQDSVDLGSSYKTIVTNLSYSKAINEKFLLGVGISYDLNGSSTGKTRTILNGDFYTKTHVRNHNSIYFQPS
jgi:hypothetical protein